MTTLYVTYPFSQGQALSSFHLSALIVSERINIQPSYGTDNWLPSLDTGSTTAVLEHMNI